MENAPTRPLYILLTQKRFALQQALTKRPEKSAFIIPFLQLHTIV